MILALGQQSDTAFLRNVPGVEFDDDGTVRVSSSLMTGCPGVFAGGDMVPSERTVTVGVGHGKRAARHINAYLRDSSYERPPKHPMATFDALHLWYFGDTTRRRQPELDLRERATDFGEVVGGLTAEHGPEHVDVLLGGLVDWMTRKGFGTVRDMRGLLALPANEDETAYERHGYVRVLQTAARTYRPW